MADPVLAMHRHSAGCYEMSALRTASMRDQMLRATVLVERLLDTGHIGRDSGCGLLVIGGGAAGLCAAKRASERGIEVHLAEANGHLLGTQRGVTTRHIDPVEYDWPHGHWDREEFPAGLGRPLPFRFVADTATNLAMAWDYAFQRYVVKARAPDLNNRLGTVHVHYRTRVQSQDIQDLGAGSPYPVSNIRWQRTAGVSYAFGAALSCVGFGAEDVRVGHFSGVRFWANDNMDQWPATDKVLVSGGGDGAMQDLQRAATGRFGRALFDALDVGRLIGLCGVPTNLAAVEDAHRRLLAWGAPNTLDAAMLQSWHRPFEQVADAIASYWDQDAGTLQQALGQIRRPHVTWAMKHQLPGPCYALNRLLALLVVRLLERLPGSQGHPHFLPGKELFDVQQVPGPSSFAHFRDGTTLPVDRVVVRHGIQKTQGVPLFGNAPISTQQVPFALI